MEDIEKPGYRTVYNGVTSSTQTQFSISAPEIKPSKYYRLAIQSKNCGLYSDETYITVASGSVPTSPAAAPVVASYDTPT